MENNQGFQEGQEYNQGQATYNPGQTAYNQGQSAYNPGQQAYSQGQSAYNPGQQAYSQGQSAYNPGQQAYNPNAQYNQGQAAYQAAYQPAAGNEVMSVKDWLITLLIVSIPVAGIIMLFIWGFGDSASQNKKNFSKAYLILMAIGIAIGILVSFLIVGLFMSIASSSGLLR